MDELLSALLDYFALSVPTGQEGRKAIVAWGAAATLTFTIAIWIVLG